MKLVTSQEERIKQMQMVLPIMMTVPRDMSIENYFPINSETLHPPVCRNRVNITFLETFLLCFPKYSSQHRSWRFETMPLFLAHHQLLIDKDCNPEHSYSKTYSACHKSHQ